MDTPFFSHRQCRRKTSWCFSLQVSRMLDVEIGPCPGMFLTFHDIRGHRGAAQSRPRPDGVRYGRSAAVRRG